MVRYLTIAAMLAVLAATAPSFAVTAKDKMATCKFGADHQKLKGAARKKFMSKCMSSKDEPRGSPAPGGASPPKQ